MNVPPENIIVNSCEYTPIYLIPSTSVTQAGSYIITQSNQDSRKPVADNLKTYYENSGNIESGILTSPKPRILRKQSASVVGNNLKLASFLLPKGESINVTNIASLTAVHPQPQPIVQPKQPIPALNNVIVKTPVTTTTTTATPAPTVISNIDSSLPRVEIDRKIVRVGTIPTTKRVHYPRPLPKTKRLVPEPKDLKEKTELNLSKHTSVQLIKLGETYHSLNQLSDDQMKIVNKALKMFSDPEKIPKEPAYDPVTNTKFIYKVVSPRDLTVVGRNKNVVMKKKNEAKKQKVVVDEEPEEEEEVPIEVAPKVTRSGRTVKLPKQMRASDAPHRPKKKVGSVISCYQCSAEFCSLYRLQRHYDSYPTHIPARIHSNLFHCLLAVIKGASSHDQANIFIQQLEQLIEKIRTLLPCLLKNVDGQEGKLCTISEDIARVLGINPGKYNFNMDALNCVKDKDGHCIHNPAPKPILVNADMSKPSQIWLSKHKDEIPNTAAETEDCARVHSVDKWPNVTKRIWKLRQQKQQKINAKKMRLMSEPEQPIDLGTEDVIAFSMCNKNSALNIGKTDGSQEVKNGDLEDTDQQVEEPSVATNGLNEKPKTHAQFHSAHFDIRSSPIKLPSSLVRKFQLHPDKMTNFEVQILRPLSLDKDNPDQTQSNDDIQTSLQELLRDNVELPKEPVMNNELNFDTPKSWQLTDANESTDSFMKTNILFETGLTPVKNGTLHINDELLSVDDKQNCLFDTPSKSNDLIEGSLLEAVEKSNNLIESSLLHASKSNGLFDSSQPMIDGKGQNNDFCDPASIHRKPKCNSLIGSSVIQLKGKSFESALSHVKERSNNLFDESMLQTPNKCNGIVEPMSHCKHESLFDTDLSNGKERSNSLFEISLLDIKRKDSVLSSSMLQDDNSNMFNPSISHNSKDDEMMEQNEDWCPRVHSSSSLNGTSLIQDKNVKDQLKIDMHHEVNMGTNENRLLNSSQSVLNFLDSLGNESLGLSYPETEIRNNPVDFQLDLFSFSNS